MAQDVLNGRTSELVEDTRRKLVSFEKWIEEAVANYGSLIPATALRSEWRFLKENVEELIYRTGQ